MSRRRVSFDTREAMNNFVANSSPRPFRRESYNVVETKRYVSSTPGWSLSQGSSSSWTPSTTSSSLSMTKPLSTSLSSSLPLSSTMSTPSYRSVPIGRRASSSASRGSYVSKLSRNFEGEDAGNASKTNMGTPWSQDIDALDINRHKFNKWTNNSSTSNSKWISNISTNNKWTNNANTNNRWSNNASTNDNRWTSNANNNNEWINNTSTSNRWTNSRQVPIQVDKDYRFNNDRSNEWYKEMSRDLHGLRRNVPIHQVN